MSQLVSCSSHMSAISQGHHVSSPILLKHCVLEVFGVGAVRVSAVMISARYLYCGALTAAILKTLFLFHSSEASPSSGAANSMFNAVLYAAMNLLCKKGCN